MSTSLYSYLVQKNDYNSEIKQCVENTVEKLLDKGTEADCPGMLLGKIQSGKTKTFIGIMGLAFDKGYDYCVILTKSTKALVQQTIQRLESEFELPLNQDLVDVHDIMKMPSTMTPYVLGKKLIFVVKKQTKNLDRLAAFFAQYPSARDKKILIIDDEADYASIGFQKAEDNELITLRTIADKIGKVRALVSTDFLQVTATPYSLYLQPDAEVLKGTECFPARPKFTELVPIHDLYVGGKVYFEGLHEKTNQPLGWARFLHIQVNEKEVEVLRKPDQRYITGILTTPNLETFRLSIATYLIAGCIRILQENSGLYKSSFIIHTEVGKLKHEWQKCLVESFLKRFKIELDASSPIARDLISASLSSIRSSLLEANMPVPLEEDIIPLLKSSLENGHIVVRCINSDNDILALLDRRGQLRLDNPFNIFIGGQILDRGVTIDNLLGFFYGRTPKKFQQDTVLQHSRMYGARTVKDMAVTRLYATARVYTEMSKMHDLDSALRESFEKGQNNDGVVFIEIDPTGQIRPCAPNKILIPHTTTLTPHKRLLPVGFQTQPKSVLQKLTPEIDRFIEDNAIEVKEGAHKINLIHAKELLCKISAAIKDPVIHTWNIKTILAILDHICDVTNDGMSDLDCLIRKDRNICRLNESGLSANNPDSGRHDLTPAKQLAEDVPCLILTRQQGLEEQGWTGYPFWWPILVIPRNFKTKVFSHKI